MKKTLLLFSVLFLAHQGVSQSYEAVADRLQTRLDSLYEASNVPGVSFSIVFPDGTAQTLTAGYANVEKQEKMTAQTKMLGGSTGKVFYSVVALQLIEEGKLSLDEPIASKMSDYDWFSRLPNAEALTVRNLMRHETGIPRYVFKETFQQEVVKDADRVWKPEELLAYVFDDEPLFEVGSQFAYSDTNYIVLCMLIEKVTGNDLYDEVQKRVLKKAGLKNVVPQNKRKYKGLAQGYNAEDDPFFPGNALDEKGKSRYNLQFEWAGGGLVITTHDLAVLAKKIYEGEMFDIDLLEEYLDGRSAGQLGGDWGLGVHIRETPKGKFYGHSGFMPGYITNMMYHADDGYAFCFQVNTSDRSRLSIMRGLTTLAMSIGDELKK